VYTAQKVQKALETIGFIVFVIGGFGIQSGKSM
jgi:hypothetical protein